MSIQLYPSIAKIKRNGVYENLPGFVPETGSIATQQMIATSESSATAQYVHNKGEYFRLNDTLYQAIVKINVGDTIVVGTNCEVAVLGNDVTHIANSIAEYELGIATAPHSTGEYFMVGETLYVATDDIAVGDSISTSNNCRLAVMGDELSGLQTAFTYTNIEKFTYTDELYYAQFWAVATGELTTGSSWIRSNERIDDSVISIEMLSNKYKLFLLAYQDSTYIGTWFGNGWSKTYDATYVTRFIDVAYFRRKYPNYQFYLDITALVGGPNFNEVVENIVFNRSTVKNQDITIKTLYGNIENPELWEYGYIDTNGNKAISIAGQYKRLSTLCYIKSPLPLTIKPKDGYAISVSTYSNAKTLEKQFSAWSTLPYTLTEANKLYKIVIKASAETNLSISEIGNYIESKILFNAPYNRLLSEISNVKAVNHRGYNTIAPENTLPAFELSAELGYKYVEGDVLFTSDGTPVIMHDDTIDRTCCLASDGSAVTGDIAIDSLTYSDLTSTYDACTSAQWAKWKGTKVPTFAEFMHCCKARNLHPWIELKWTHTYTQSEVQLIISIIKQYGMEENVTFISFSEDALSLVATEWDTVELGLNGTVSNALALQTGKNRVFMIYSYSDDYSAAITAGLQVCIYTVNTETALSNVSNQGFDSVLTNVLLPSQINDVVRSKYETANS